MADTQTSDSSSSISRASSDSDLSSKVSDSELGAVGGADKMAGVSEQQKCPMEDAINKLLEKQRSEIMSELRKLKVGDRPVTGQENKKTVEDFFNSRLNPNAEPTPGDQHRPESVVVEVQGLVQTRPVSSILQSAQFRRTLENAIRGGLSSLSNRVPLRSQQVSRPSTPQSASPAPPPPPAPPLDPTVIQRIGEGAANVPHFPVLPAQPAGMRVASRTQQSQQQVQSQAAPEPMETEPAPTLVPEVPAPVRAQAWLQQVPQVDAREQVRMSVWENIEQAQRESIVMDISELVQAQLVTQTLSGGFRNTLEARMRDHLDSSGTDGRRVQEFLQSLPPAPHARNDFSDLGIQAPGQQAAASLSDNLDNISVISATAAVQVQTQQQSLMSREMRALKAQMQEMKEMLKMSLDMQMDIQRAIRQEVAAAVAANLGPIAQAPLPRSTQPVNDTHCLICLDAAADTVLYQCGHLCLCYTCGMQLQNRGANCPVCRAPIKDIMRVYKSGHTPE